MEIEKYNELGKREAIWGYPGERVQRDSLLKKSRMSKDERQREEV